MHARLLMGKYSCDTLQPEEDGTPVAGGALSQRPAGLEPAQGYEGRDGIPEPYGRYQPYPREEVRLCRPRTSNAPPLIVTPDVWSAFKTPLERKHRHSPPSPYILRQTPPHFCSPVAPALRRQQLFYYQTCICPKAQNLTAGGGRVPAT